MQGAVQHVRGETCCVPGPNTSSVTLLLQCTVLVGEPFGCLPLEPCTRRSNDRPWYFVYEFELAPLDRNALPPGGTEGFGPGPGFASSSSELSDVSVSEYG